MMLSNTQQERELSPEAAALNFTSHELVPKVHFLLDPSAQHHITSERRESRGCLVPLSPYFISSQKIPTQLPSHSSQQCPAPSLLTPQAHFHLKHGKCQTHSEAEITGSCSSHQASLTCTSVPWTKSACTLAITSRLSF